MAKEQGPWMEITKDNKDRVFFLKGLSEILAGEGQGLTHQITGGSQGPGSELKTGWGRGLSS